MKESKIASFKNLSFGADFENGNLLTLSVIGAKSDTQAVLDGGEASELSDWLSGLLNKGHKLAVADHPAYRESYPALGFPASSIDTNDATINRTGGYIQAYPDTTLPMRERPSLDGRNTHKRVTDAESVAKRLPIEKALAGDGMKLESKEIAPIQVRIEK